MNMQAMLKQAQKLQKDMMNSKTEIDNTLFECTKSFITIKAYGNKKLESIKIDIESIDNEEMETVQDLLLVTMNELMDKIDKETESKMGKFSQGMPGLF